MKIILSFQCKIMGKHPIGIVRIQNLSQNESNIVHFH